MNDKILCIDLDDTLTFKNGLDYTIDSLPDHDMIDLVNTLHDKGYTIYIYTSRKMRSSNQNPGEALCKHGANTFAWLRKHKVKFDGLFQKPHATYYIDNQFINYNREKVIQSLKDLINES